MNTVTWLKTSATCSAGATRDSVGSSASNGIGRAPSRAREGPATTPLDPRSVGRQLPSLGRLHLPAGGLFRPSSQGRGTDPATLGSKRHRPCTRNRRHEPRRLGLRLGHRVHGAPRLSRPPVLNGAARTSPSTMVRKNGPRGKRGRRQKKKDKVTLPPTTGQEARPEAPLATPHLPTAGRRPRYHLYTNALAEMAEDQAQARPSRSPHESEGESEAAEERREAIPPLNTIPRGMSLAHSAHCR